MARPSATRCCWPPESCEGLRSSSASSPSSSAARFEPLVASRRAGTLRTERPKVMFSATRKMRKQRVVLEHHRDAALRRRQRGDVAAVDAHRAGARASRGPAMMRSVVDLPQPEGPSRTQNVPSSMRRSMACSAVVSLKDFEIPSSSIDDIGAV